MEKFHIKHILFVAGLAILLASCSSLPAGDAQPTPDLANQGVADGLEVRHNTQLPLEYAGLSDPTAANEESISRGASLYALHCASCHGEDGLGDGPAGTALDPAPAPLAETSKMIGDDYLFWRISEGSGPFSTAMPAWKAALDERSRWDLIHYMRTLGD